MLPESSLRQLKKLRQEVKGKDINDLVSKAETHFPNVYWMDNPVDGGRIQSYEDFIKKDNKKQTTAFKSKLVNKPLVNSELNENTIAKCNNCKHQFDYLSVQESGMGYVKCPKCNKPVTQKNIKKMELKNLIDFKEFDIKKNIKNDNKIAKDIVKESMEENGLYLIYSEDDGLNELHRGEFSTENSARKKASELYVEMNNEIEHYDVVGPFESDGDVDAWINEYDDETDKSFEKKLNEAFEGVNAEEESKNLFGFAQVKDQTIKKVGSFTSFTKMIDPKTPKERPVLNAGQFIDNNVVSGYINRVEGNKVFVESLDKPGEIIEVSIKDAIKVKKEEKEHTVTKKIKESKVEKYTKPEKIEKLLKDQKSGFYKFTKKNKGLKTLGRDYIKGDNEKLYDFFISKKDPKWEKRMAKTT